jgi:hypothetical protein
MEIYVAVGNPQFFASTRPFAPLAILRTRSFAGQLRQPSEISGRKIAELPEWQNVRLGADAEARADLWPQARRRVLFVEHTDSIRRSIAEPAAKPRADPISPRSSNFGSKLLG